MASLPSLQLRHPFHSFSPHPFPSRRAAIPPARAAESESETAADAATPESDDFEERLAQVRIRYRSGVGKKAEQRKARRSGSTKKKGSGGVFLPPVPLTEPVSGGLKVDFGFSPYTERLNGRLAMLGLAALLLVELGSGKSLITYHAPGTILIQVYFVAAVAALYVKYEKEKVSIWPESSKK